MIKSFILSYRIKNAYRANAVIYSIKQIPIIKQIISSTLYGNSGIKVIGNLISLIIEFLSIFSSSLIYLMLFYILPIQMFDNKADTFVTIFIFLTIVGGLFNTNMFDPSKDKFYAIILMRFDAKKYVLSNYIYFLVKTVLGFIPFVLIAYLSYKVNILICISLPIFVIFIKNIFNAINLIKYNKKRFLNNENKPQLFNGILAVVLIILAYSLPYFNIQVGSIIYLIILIVAFILSVISVIYIIKFPKYKNVYNDLFKGNDINSNDLKKVNKDMYEKQITYDIKDLSSKKGYAYFNDIFVRRHKKLLSRASKRISLISILIFILLIICSIIFKDFSKEINSYLEKSLAYYLFIMYFINRGQTITQTMFMNCDHSMLTFRFYKQQSAILSLFKERLITLIKLNIVPGVIIAVGSTILLYTSGGTDLINYLVTFVSIISMSIFFSVHYLVLYYLLQPYNIDLKIKNPLFSIICGLTYYVCYMSIQIKMPIIVFGSVIIVFTLVYCLVGLFLAYKLAPKTFKLRN